MIRFVPTGGLCDRITTIESFLSIAKQLKEPKMKMIWLMNNELNSRFEDVLSTIPGIEVENRIEKIHKKGFFFRIKRKLLREFREKVLKRKFLDLNKLDVDNKFQFVIDFLNGNSNYVMISGLLMSNKEDDFYNSITPNTQIQKNIDKLILEFPFNIIGIHIRRTDNVHSIQNSPSELFYKTLDSEIELDKTVKFYVATDSEIELERLIQKYKERIIYQKECIRSRITDDGMRSAVIDLFLLAKTTKIIGSDWSAFSTAAARLGKITLIRMKNK